SVVRCYMYLFRQPNVICRLVKETSTLHNVQPTTHNAQRKCRLRHLPPGPRRALPSEEQFDKSLPTNRADQFTQKAEREDQDADPHDRDPIARILHRIEDPAI